MKTLDRLEGYGSSFAPGAPAIRFSSHGRARSFLLHVGLVLMMLLVPAFAWAESESVQASSTESTFKRANDAYFAGRYAESVQGYEQLVALGIRSVDLFYNLGNAYLKLGTVGPAIYNYERALELDPTQSGEDAQFNLRAARETAGKLGTDRLVGGEGNPIWMRVSQPFTLGFVSWLFLGLYLAVFGLLTVQHFLRPGFLQYFVQRTCRSGLDRRNTLVDSRWHPGRIFQRSEHCVIQ